MDNLNQTPIVSTATAVDRPRQRWPLVVAPMWLLVTLAGTWFLWRYANVPGESASPPTHWPHDATRGTEPAGRHAGDVCPSALPLHAGQPGRTGTDHREVPRRSDARGSSSTNHRTPMTVGNEPICGELRPPSPARTSSAIPTARRQGIFMSQPRGKLCSTTRKEDCCLAAVLRQPAAMKAIIWEKPR